MLVSVVMAYHNRRPQIERTLRSISESSHNEVQVIIVDDTLGPDTLSGIKGECRFPIEIHKVNRRVLGPNPCRKFNVGFKHAQGQLVMIQNPENLHCGDVISEAVSLSGGNRYLLFSCRHLPTAECNRLTGCKLTRENILPVVCPSGNLDIFIKRRPELHWCSALMKADLADLNGFDERFGSGPDFDDDEFYMRVNKKGMQVINLGEDRPFVFHQEHPSASFGFGHVRNKRLFEIAKRDRSYRANPSKRIM